MEDDLDIKTISSSQLFRQMEDNLNFLRCSSSDFKMGQFWPKMCSFFPGKPKTQGKKIFDNKCL